MCIRDRYGEEGMKERMKALSDMEETQLLKEIETSGRELTLSLIHI